MTRYLKHARFLAGALALVVGLTLVATPAFAAGPAPGPIAAAATAKVEAMPAEALAQAAPATPAAKAAPAAPTAPSTSSPSFFKTGKGIAVLVLVAAGVGYSGYSAVHDRKPVKSPIR